MADKKRTQKEINRLKTIERQLSTWKKASAKNPKFEQKYLDILVLAEEHGMLTPSGKVSKSKKAYSNMDEFYMKYKATAGSVNKFTQREKRKWRQENMLLLEQGLETLSFTDYEKMSNKLNTLIKKLYSNYPSDNAYDLMQLHVGETKEDLIESINLFMKENSKEELIPLEKLEKQYDQELLK